MIKRKPFPAYTPIVGRIRNTTTILRTPVRIIVEDLSEANKSITAQSRIFHLTLLFVWSEKSALFAVGAANVIAILILRPARYLFNLFNYYGLRTRNHSNNYFVQVIDRFQIVSVSSSERLPIERTNERTVRPITKVLIIVNCTAEPHTWRNSTLVNI